MEESGPVPNPRRWRKRGLIGLVVFLALLFAWHLYLSAGLSSRVRSLPSGGSSADTELLVSVNPLTNLVSMTIAMPPDLDDDNPFAALGSALGETIIQAIGPGFIERELNTRAREQYDLYAILVPYSVRVSTAPASLEAAARIREEREKRKAEEIRTKAKAEAERFEAIRSYAASALSLERVRVAAGEHFGRHVDSVFGTIVNNGAKTLRKVTVRVYFLDKVGRRIGEKDYSPVLVTDFAIGDNTPLRPSYRKDFGYNIEAAAPSGWSKRVEVEIVDLEFSVSEK